MSIDTLAAEVENAALQARLDDALRKRDEAERAKRLREENARLRARIAELETAP